VFAQSHQATIKMNLKLSILSVLLLAFMLTCQDKKQEKASISFYYWRTQLELDSLERSYLEALKVEKLYLRFFDVSWNPNQNQAQPLGILQIKEGGLPLAQLKQIIPTIFITHQTLLNLSDSLRTTLAEKIVIQIKQIQENTRFKKLFPKAKITEIQLDCDWTPQSRAAYFDLIEIVKNKVKSQQSISVTLRLHQYRYPQKTGIPPVLKANLMCYNTGNLQDLETQNSILDLATVESYLPRDQKYPIQLNYAVPIFSWAVLIRSGRVVNLISNVSRTDFTGNDFQKTEPENHFQVLKSHYFKGIYLYKEDVIRYEFISPEKLQQLAKLLRQRIQNSAKEWVFYHLNTTDLERFSVEDLRKVSE